MNTDVETEAQAYLDRLRRELAGLPAAEIEEIVQDLEPQVAAIAADLGAEPASTTLADLLGDPAEYARELRSAMGVPDEPPAWAPPLWLTRTSMWTLVVTTAAAVVAGYLIGRIHSDDPRPALLFLAVALAASWLAVGRHRTAAGDIAALPEVRLVAARLTAAEHYVPVLGYLTSLRPAWHLARGALTGIGTLWLLGWCGWQGAGATVPALAVAALTVAVGHRAAHDRRWLWLSVPLGGWAAGVTLKAMELLPALAAGEHAWF